MDENIKYGIGENRELGKVRDITNVPMHMLYLEQ